MFVRKFEADSLEEALKEIKSQLGPDAIILKTITNKGFKGAFKKKKIEITAAISEKNYEKKAKVDSVLTNDQKETFYQSEASYVSNMINDHSDNRPSLGASGYGQMGLNKTVHSTKVQTQNTAPKSDLDTFLEQNPFEKKEALKQTAREETKVYKEQFEMPASLEEEMTQAASPAVSASSSSAVSSVDRKRIDELELRIHELTKNVEKFEKPEPIGIFQMRSTLRSLDINEHYINRLVKKCIFELSEADLEDVDLVYDFALREMLGAINCSMPLFSSTTEGQVVTVLLSDTASGQSSLAYKLAALKPGSQIIRAGEKEDRKFTEKVFNLDIKTAYSDAEIASLVRKGLEAGKDIFVDYKNLSNDKNETKKFIDGLKRSFPQVEVMITLSAIHSELYNNKVINSYGALASGLVMTNLDMCVNFGSVFNTFEKNQHLSVKFFGNGPVVPEDIEAATSERILGALFELN